MSTKTTVTSLILALVAGLFISACGWQLRGTGAVPAGMESLHISSQSPSGGLVREMRNTLDSAGIAVEDNATDARYSLVILDQRSRVRTATVNPNARISEQQLTDEVDFTVLDGEGSTLIPPTTVISDRVFEYDENNILATQDEREMIREEMQRDLVRQIFNRFRQLKE